MKVQCEYCDSYYDDSALKCPYCGGHNKEEKYENIEIENELIEQDSNKHAKWVLLIFVIVISSLSIVLFLLQRNEENKKDVAFLQNALSYRKDSNYSAAIDELKKIDKNSKVYSDANEYLYQIMQEYEKYTETKAESFFDNKDYASCLALINSTGDCFSGNEVIQRIQQEASTIYLDDVITSAKRAYFAEGVSTAKAIVNDGLRIVPENRKLMKLKELLDSVVAEKGSNMRFQNSNDFFQCCSSYMNSYGDMLSGDLFTFLGNDWNAPWCEFFTAEKYTSFSCKVDANIMKEEHQLQMKIFLDDTLAYDSGVVDRTWKGKDIVLDVSGVYSVKIEVYNLVGISHEWENPNPRIIVMDPTFIAGLSENDFVNVDVE